MEFRAELLIAELDDAGFLLELRGLVLALDPEAGVDADDLGVAEVV